MAKDDPKMAGWRPRNAASGRLRKKRSDTKVATLEKRYHRRIGSKPRIQLGMLLKRRRKKSLKKVLR